MERINHKITQDQPVVPTSPTSPRPKRRYVRRNVNTVVVKQAIDTDARDANDAGVATLPALRPDLPAQPVSPPHTAITVSPLDLPSDQFRSGLDRRKQNRQALMDWIRSALVDGVDFGRVHIASKDKCDLARAGRVKECTNPYHWSKPSLFKPGAEKISGMLGMTVHYPSLVAYETAILSGLDVTQVMMRCELHDAQGRVVAEGVGARNLTQDLGDINKVFKMSLKSAHIDATLRLAGLSEVFTQDLEDRPAEDAAVTESAAKPAPVKPVPKSDNGFTSPASTPAPSTSTASPSSTKSPPAHRAPDDTDLIDSDDLQTVRERVAEVGISEKRVLAWLYKVTKGTVTRFDQLNVAQCTTLLKRLDLWGREAAQAAA